MRDNDILDGKDDFEIWTPSCVEIIRKSGEDVERTRPIGGICSTEALDRQDESVFAKGLDFGEFVKHGYFNDNHKQNTADILGYPSMAELRKGRWWTEGNLLLDWEPSNRVWALAKALSKSTAKRRLGFSIEGKVVERGIHNKILKAIIRHVAITNSPVNTDCKWDILAKAFGSMEELEAGSLRRALSAGSASPAVSGGRALSGRVERKPIKLTFDEAVKVLKSNRPQYSWSTCERLARVIFKQERRN
jgi:Herelleviridae head maturation protease